MADGTQGTVTGMAGVLIWTDNFEPMRRFYVETLGLEPRSDREGFVNFEWQGLRLTVSVHHELHGRARDPLRIMVNLTVDDMDAMYERLRAAGVAFARPPEREKWGGRVATFSDPDGNTLQLFELPRG